MKSELITMSKAELIRLQAMHHLQAGTLRQADVARQLSLSVRQIKRLWRAYQEGGAGALLSKRRGRPGNRRLDPHFVARAVHLVRTHYPDFGPTFAGEKLLERHGLHIARETLRQAMIADGLWQAKRAPRRAVHRPRDRRPCFGELVQIDGSAHAWFEDRGPRCTLLVFVDDATSQLVGLRFVQSETTWGYFDLLERYLRREGKPLSLYGDRSSIFRQTRPALASNNQTQFARAMDALHIQVICANSPQAKGRVERANGVLQDRMVKELRLHGISTIDAANDYVEEFRSGYNARFAVEPASSVNAHRPLDQDDDLSRIFTMQFPHTISANLTLQHRNIVYEILEPLRARRLRHVAVNVCEARSGRVRIELKGLPLRHRVAVRHTAQGSVLTRKELNCTDGARPVSASKAHAPAPNHPWKKPLPQRDPQEALYIWRERDKSTRR